MIMGFAATHLVATPAVAQKVTSSNQTPKHVKVNAPSQTNKCNIYSHSAWQNIKHILYMEYLHKLQRCFLYCSISRHFKISNEVFENSNSIFLVIFFPNKILFWALQILQAETMLTGNRPILIRVLIPLLDFCWLCLFHWSYKWQKGIKSSRNWP